MEVAATVRVKPDVSGDKPEQAKLERRNREEHIHPCKILFLRDHAFRMRDPAVFGVRVLAGRLLAGRRLIREDGKLIIETLDPALMTEILQHRQTANYIDQPIDSRRALPARGEQLEVLEPAKGLVQRAVGRERSRTGPLAQLLGEPGVAALPVGEDRGATVRSGR